MMLSSFIGVEVDVEVGHGQCNENNEIAEERDQVADDLYNHPVSKVGYQEDARQDDGIEEGGAH